MGRLEDDAMEAKRRLDADQAEALRRMAGTSGPQGSTALRDQMNAHAGPPGSAPPPGSGQSEIETRWEDREEMIALQKRYLELVISKLPRRMNADELRRFTDATQAIQAQRRAQAASELPKPAQATRDMSPEDFKKYEAQWNAAAFAKGYR